MKAVKVNIQMKAVKATRVAKAVKANTLKAVKAIKVERDHTQVAREATTMKKVHLKKGHLAMREASIAGKKAAITVTKKARKAITVKKGAAALVKDKWMTSSFTIIVT
jgi:hypothetical protein